MKKKINKFIIILIAVFIVASGWHERYALLYYYYLLRIDNSSEGGEIIYFEEQISTLSSHVPEMLTNTYKDINVSPKRRHAAALALISNNSEKAEAIFMSFLDSKNDAILADSIQHLGIVKSMNSYGRVLNFINHPSEAVRLAVVGYLGHCNNDDSLINLNYLANNDGSQKVKTWARYQIQLLKRVSKE